MSVSSDDCLCHQIAANHGNVTRLGRLGLWEVPHSKLGEYISDLYGHYAEPPKEEVCQVWLC